MARDDVIGNYHLIAMMTYQLCKQNRQSYTFCTNIHHESICSFRVTVILIINKVFSKTLRWYNNFFEARNCNCNTVIFGQ